MLRAKKYLENNETRESGSATTAPPHPTSLSNRVVAGRVEAGRGHRPRLQHDSGGEEKIGWNADPGRWSLGRDGPLGRPLFGLVDMDRRPTRFSARPAVAPYLCKRPNFGRQVFSPVWDGHHGGSRLAWRPTDRQECLSVTGSSLPASGRYRLRLTARTGGTDRPAKRRAPQLMILRAERPFSPSR